MEPPISIVGGINNPFLIGGAPPCGDESGWGWGPVRLGFDGKLVGARPGSGRKNMETIN